MNRLLKASLRKVIAGLGYEVRRRRDPSGAFETETSYRSAQHGQTYVERAECGASNFAEKEKRTSRGEPFEWPEILNLNRKIATLLEGEKLIAEVGCGTGAFAHAAALDRSRTIVASEFDADALEWARCNRSAPNIEYVHGPIPLERGTFDLVVAIEVVEHIADYATFLRECCRLAPRAIITTPNRSRAKEHHHAGPPQYFQHVREWTVGEFYWVLRSFYGEVLIYGMKDPSRMDHAVADVDSTLSPMIADCRRPRLW